MPCGGLGILVLQCDYSNGEEGAEAEAVQCPAGHTQISIAHSEGWQIFPLVQ